MRTLGTVVAIASALAACSGHPGSLRGPSDPVVAAQITAFPALRFVPGHPTYLVAARDVASAQRALIDIVESFGMVLGVTRTDVSRELERLLAIDPLSPDVAGKLGVDLAGGFAVFSTDVEPTVVVHLAAPEAAKAFFDHLLEQGVRTQSVIVDGVEVTTAQVVGSLHASWAIDKDWLWVHFRAKSKRPDPATENAWFASAHRGAGGDWSRDFGRAQQLDAHANVVGVVDAPAIVRSIAAAVPQSTLDCLALLRPVHFAGFAIEGDGTHVAGRIAIGLGAPAGAIAQAIIPPPAGFDALAAPAPLALQANLDLSAALKWAEPCTSALRIDTSALTQYGARTARVVLASLDPDDKSGTGVAALDLSSKAYLDAQLDQIPQRSLFESKRTFGAFAGHHLKIPFVVSFDYVLDDRHAYLGMGDGLLDKLFAGTPTTTAPLLAIDIKPPKLRPEAWRFLLAQLANERYAKPATERLLRWRDGHVAISIDHEALVIDAVGNRR